MRKATAALFAATLMAALSLAQETPSVPQVTGSEQLVKEKGRFQETWVRPDADISRYSKLYLWQTTFQFRDVGKTPRTQLTSASLSGSDGPYEIRDEDRQRFQQIVKDALVKELARSTTFEMVDTPGPNTLILRAMVLDITSDVPPKTTGYTEVYLSAVGEATLVFELIDAETGVIQARAGERQRIQPPGRMVGVSSVPANSATVWADVQVWATNVARDLRVALDKAQNKARK